MRGKVIEDHAHTMYRLYQELNFHEGWSLGLTRRTVVKNCKPDFVWLLKIDLWFVLLLAVNMFDVNCFIVQSIHKFPSNDCAQKILQMIKLAIHVL